MALSLDSDERELQRQFLLRYMPRVDSSLTREEILRDYTDGIVRGCLIEMKGRVADLNSALFQGIRYASSLRVKGKPVPANILIVSLSDAKAWHFRTEAYLPHVERQYVGPASKHVGGFIAGDPENVLDLSSGVDQERLVQLMRVEEFARVNIDESCIVGWAETYYRLSPSATKQDFLGYQDENGGVVGEIRSPSKLRKYIRPYTGGTNIRFEYLMDKLNDFLSRKDLGAFYTPVPFAKLAAKLLRKAIARVPDGNDYVIIDRCAGTGILEEALSDEELSHCIVSTYEYFEYKVLMERLGDRVRHVIPPIETEDTYAGGRVRGSDALSKEFVDNDVIMRYRKDPNCTIILYENPPFAETTSMEHQSRGAGRKSSQGWKGSWLVEQMRSDVKADPMIDGRTLNDKGNVFIWSGFKYYLRQPTDSYLVFSPIKYWKAQGLVNKKVLGGFACNRKLFGGRKHACVAVVLYSNEPSKARRFSLDAYDIVDGKAVKRGKRLPFIKVRTRFSDVYYDSRPLVNAEPTTFCVDGDGLPARHVISIKPQYSDTTIGYLVADSYGLEQPDLRARLFVAPMYNGHGFYLRRDNYLEKLPLFVSGRYTAFNLSWTERGRVMRTADGAREYQRAIRNGTLDQWLRKCLLFCSLDVKAHMVTQRGTDGRMYRNELCLDTTNGETVASKDLRLLSRGEPEEELLAAWSQVLSTARKCTEYQPDLTYGPYQIDLQINTRHKDDDGRTIYDHPELNGALRALRDLVKAYYLQTLLPTLFEYKFLV